MQHQRASDIAEGVADLTGKIVYTSAGMTTIFGLTLNELAAAVGIVVTILTYFVNWYYRAKHERLLEKRTLYELKRLEKDET